MAVYGLTHGWFGNDDGPLRPCDIDWRGLDRLFNDTEEAVFRSAWEPDAGDYRPPQPQTHRSARDDEAVIFDHAWKD